MRRREHLSLGPVVPLEGARLHFLCHPGSVRVVMVEYNSFSEPFSAVHGLIVTDLAFSLSSGWWLASLSRPPVIYKYVLAAPFFALF